VRVSAAMAKQQQQEEGKDEPAAGSKLSGSSKKKKGKSKEAEKDKLLEHVVSYSKLVRIFVLRRQKSLFYCLPACLTNQPLGR